jgi:putative endopeptidase
VASNRTCGASFGICLRTLIRLIAQGRKYDENGELNDWWTDEDSAEYMRRAALLVEQFAEYKVFGVPVNGELCLGENVADLGGVKLAYIGLQRFMELHGRPKDVDGFTPEQRFFLGWATVWRNNIRKENALKRIVMDRKSSRASTWLYFMIG